ncbi:dephospho-CoA kinase [Cryptosporangium sp. NPDC048952]|uniref:dephospho-CoA kinase n=1 Tax=Cryptosporangium sp. NPDC048952 TaxID=3363961 RepID=UPI00371CA7FF
MLRIGLTGGIGAGKSAVAARLAELGAVVIDADRLAREVVEPGTPGLAAIVEAFGADVLAADGSLDRPKLGKIVFADDAARARLNGITHPLIGALTAERAAAAPPDGIVVHDIPLIVEGGSGASFHLVVVVMATEEIRLRRLTELRGMPIEDARARIAAQATDEQRVAAADVLLDNSGALPQLRAAVDALWEDRLVPYASGIANGVAAEAAGAPVPADLERAAARLRNWLHRPDLRVEQAGPLELRAFLADADEVRSVGKALAGSGWILDGTRGSTARSADPGQPTRLVLAVAP